MKPCEMTIAELENQMAMLEIAPEMEIDIFRDVLEAIADGSPIPQTLAKIALKYELIEVME